MKNILRNTYEATYIDITEEPLSSKLKRLESGVQLYGSQEGKYYKLHMEPTTILVASRDPMFYLSEELVTPDLEEGAPYLCTNECGRKELKWYSDGFMWEGKFGNGFHNYKPLKHYESFERLTVER